MQNQGNPDAAAQLPRGQGGLTVDARPLLAIAGHEDFIFAAYRQIFDRLPDFGGLLHYRFYLRAGVPKTTVLTSLAHSPEGRALRVTLNNLPLPAAHGVFSRLLTVLRLKIRWCVWRVFERPGDCVEVHLLLADSARYWELNYQAVCTLLNRQQALATQLENWRRDMEENGRKVAAAIARMELVDARSHSASAPPMLALHADDWSALEQVPNGLAALLERVLKPGMVVVDAGAGARVFSVFASRAIRPGGKLYAVEPHAGQFAQPGACDGPPSTEEGVTATSARTLDSILEGEPVVDLLRLSLDGLEPEAVEGMVRFVSSKGIQSIFLDCRSGAQSSRAGDFEAILDRLVGAGFRASRICSITGTLLPLAQTTTGEPRLHWLERDSSARRESAARGAGCR